MRHTNINLTWNVLIYDFNRKKIINFNVLNNDIIQILYKEIARKKTITNYEQLKARIKSWCMYRYWSKIEYEVSIGDYPPESIEDLEKINAYRQIDMNLDRLCEYLIKKLEIEFKK